MLIRPLTSAVALLLGTGVWGLNSVVLAGTALPPIPVAPKPPVPVTPEINMGLLLAPIAIAILLVATRQMWPKRGTQKS
ncbi:MAG: hypothetical protein JO333_16940 [Verrucomicrobia bacterium]|nr:hypothetical protein [Verrucomicrobiota bacterium]